MITQSTNTATPNTMVIMKNMATPERFEASTGITIVETIITVINIVTCVKVKPNINGCSFDDATVSAIIF